MVREGSLLGGNNSTVPSLGLLCRLFQEKSQLLAAHDSVLGLLWPSPTCSTMISPKVCPVSMPPCSAPSSLSHEPSTSRQTRLSRAARFPGSLVKHRCSFASSPEHFPSASRNSGVGYGDSVLSKAEVRCRMANSV